MLSLVSSSEAAESVILSLSFVELDVGTVIVNVADISSSALFDVAPLGAGSIGLNPISTELSSNEADVVEGTRSFNVTLTVGVVVVVCVMDGVSVVMVFGTSFC